MLRGLPGQRLPAGAAVFFVVALGAGDDLPRMLWEYRGHRRVAGTAAPFLGFVHHEGADMLRQPRPPAAGVGGHSLAVGLAHPPCGGTGVGLGRGLDGGGRRDGQVVVAQVVFRRLPGELGEAGHGLVIQDPAQRLQPLVQGFRAMAVAVSHVLVIMEAVAVVPFEFPVDVDALPAQHPVQLVMQFPGAVGGGLPVQEFAQVFLGPRDGDGRGPLGEGFAVDVGRCGREFHAAVGLAYKDGAGDGPFVEGHLYLPVGFGDLQPRGFPSGDPFHPFEALLAPFPVFEGIPVVVGPA